MQEQKNDLQIRILEAAKQIFIRKGYEATKMGDIAAEVGISRTSMHYYFRTKEMLFEAIFGQILDILMPNIDTILKEKGDIWDKLPHLINEYINTFIQHPSFPAFLITELNRDPDHLYEAITLKNLERLKPLIKLRSEIEEEIKTGNIRNLPLIDVVSTFVSLIAFPFLIQNPLKNIFLKEDSEFLDFLERRKVEVYEILVRFLKPE